MFGNTLGWGISAVLVLVMAGFSYLIHQAGASTPPTALAGDESFFATVALPVSPATIHQAGESCDGAEHYRAAIAAFNRDEFAYDRVRTLADVAKLDAFPEIIKARHCSGTRLFASQPEEVITYGDRDELEALRKISQAAGTAGLLYIKDNQLDRAEELFASLFTLGQVLYGERLTYGELDTGLTLMATGSEGLKRIAQARGDSDLAAKIDGFNQARIEYVKKTLQPRYEVVSSIGDKLIARHFGDILALAHHSQDRMWRIEAILKLGRYRFNAGRAGDQRKAAREVAKLAENDPDPLIRLAAAKARDLTIEEYRSMGR
jgi:hypothetical protein